MLSRFPRIPARKPLFVKMFGNQGGAAIARNSDHTTIETKQVKKGGGESLELTPFQIARREHLAHGEFRFRL